MPTRRYNLETRRRKQSELKARIAAATAELHASKGVADTSYADIARSAGISLPTVYKHFPTLDELLTGCTTHVAANAPELPVDGILCATTLKDAIERLIKAMEAQHRYYEPWSARRMEGYVPFLARMFEDIRRMQAGLVAKILERYLEPGPQRQVVAACETLLSFDTWYRLVRGHGLTLTETRQFLLQGLLAMTGPGTTADKPSAKRRKSL